MLRILWMEHRTNASIRDEVKIQTSLTSRISKCGWKSSEGKITNKMD